jgi:hypothetical protein
MEHLRNLEHSFKNINETLNLSRENNNRKFLTLECTLKDFLLDAEDSIALKLNTSRETLLDSNLVYRNEILTSLINNDCEHNNLVKQIKFTQSSYTLDAKLFCERLSFAQDFHILNKLKYLHLLKTNEISNIDLYDFKYHKTRVIYSQMITCNSILTLIRLDNSRGDHLLRVHKINQSSFKTAKEIIVKSMRYSSSAFWFLCVRERIYFLYTKQTLTTYIDMYDFELNQLKSIELENDLQVENFLSNKIEIIIDYGLSHWVYDLNLNRKVTYKSCKIYDGTNDDLNMIMRLINISKEFLFYLETNETRNGKNILIASRARGNVFHKRIHLNFIKLNEWSFFILIDYNSHILIKILNGKEIYFFDAFKCENDVHVCQLVSNKVDLEEYGLDAIFQAEDFLCSSNHANNCLILFRNDGKRYKHVFIV